MTQDSYLGTRHDDLVLIRVQDQLSGVSADRDGLILDRSVYKSQSYRNTFHFALNAVVENHAYGTQFDGAECVIIASFSEACNRGKNIPSGFMPADTYFHSDENGKMSLPSAVVIAPEGTSAPEGFDSRMLTYPRGSTADETRKNRDAAVSEYMDSIGAPLRRIGFDTWSGYGFIAQKDSAGISGRYGQGHEISFSRHMHAPAGEWERALPYAHALLARYLGGERIERIDSGIDKSLYSLLLEARGHLAEFVGKRHAESADPKALAFFEKGLRDFTQRMENEAQPVRRRELQEELLAGSYHVFNTDDGTTQGPVSSGHLIDAFKKGKVSPDHLIWCEWMTKWQPLRETEEHALLQEIEKIDARHNNSPTLRAPSGAAATL